MSRAEDFVTSHGGADHLAQNKLVGEAHHEAKAGRIVLVFCLDNQALASAVVGLAFATTAEFGLIPLVVSLAQWFDNESLTSAKICEISVATCRIF